MNPLQNDLLSGLNKEQQEAVKKTEGPLLIMAGAGSGKTRVLTHRIAYLLGEKDVSPRNVLAITFTNKAAREMKERVADIVGPDANEMWISTFHSMCVRILRRDIDRIGIDRNFSILDTTDQLSVIKQVLKDLNLDPKKFDPRAMLGTISSAKNELKTAEDYNKTVGSYYDQQTGKVYEKYQKTLRKNQSLDFDDLIMQTLTLFDRVPEVLEYYQRRFQYIHVDEYQDTNHAQYQLVKLLADRFQNLCVVGDSDQSIYRWRGADIANILSFESDYPNAKVIMLEQNYRSTKSILNAANEVIQQNSGRKPKNLWTDNDDGENIQYYQAPTERDEALYVVNKTEEYIRSGDYKYKDVAILYRTNAQSRTIEETFVKANVPYQIIGGTKFYDRKEIKDILAYLRLVSNPNDDISFSRIVNEPKRGIGKTSLENLQMYAAQNDLSMYEAVGEVEFVGLSKKATNALKEFGSMVKNWHQQQDFLSATDLVEDVLKKTGYEEMLKNEKSLEAQSRLENINEFLSVAQDFEKNNEDKSLIAFLTDLALIADIDKVDDDPFADNKVTLMTLHSAKGLEFPIVFLIGMEENVFPHSRSIMDEEEMEEERRLAYVGITRAEKQLFLTHAKMRTLFGKTNMNPISRFIDEIPADLIEGRDESAGSSPFGGGGFSDPAPKGFNSMSGGGLNGGMNQAPKAKQQPKRKATMNKKPSTGGESVSWATGDKVSHKKWGEGTVVKVQGSGDSMELDIAFPAPTGIKRVLAKFAPITKG
ncbi:DNA helicase PcrA [Pontibacillus marinus]|uniref:ATP-dependent DNA helicase n=1 Tax=Pontibacillus marinus BH030004 = DSM 16465 TaxID=1385511 RepID=A0A0A5GC60_9BACI|nr:DNA helicase PcrA [Pontibacillus marinus]KGX88695.1 ATP-dependent DNA helicase PcrA [Pontibacillus marinus BH030004 = DSM 16465]